MSDVNKLDNFDKKCFINPEQYKNNGAIAPVGSYPWAMIQLYLGDLVYRNIWDYPNEYIGLVPESGVNEGGDLSYLIKKRVHNQFEQWQPEQEDMMACDWVKMDFMLSFDILIGTANATLPKSKGHVAWGYVKDGYKEDMGEWSKYFGDLKVIQNKTDIVETTSFYWHETSDHSDDVILWIAYSDTSQENFHNLKNFFQTKELHITVDGVTYNLGKSTATTTPEYEYAIDNVYKSNDATKLGAILKHTGETKRLYVNWV